MKRIAMIKDNVVENVAALANDSLWNPGSEYVLVDVTKEPNVSSGMLYLNGIFKNNDKQEKEIEE